MLASTYLALTSPSRSAAHSCVPMPSALVELASSGRVADSLAWRARGRATLLEPPEWEAYEARLRAEGLLTRASIALSQHRPSGNTAFASLGMASGAGGLAAARDFDVTERMRPTQHVSFEAFAAAVLAANASSTAPPAGPASTGLARDLALELATSPAVLELPARLLVHGVPADVLRRCEGCVSAEDPAAASGLPETVEPLSIVGFCAETKDGDPGDCFAPPTDRAAKGTFVLSSASGDSGAGEQASSRADRPQLVTAADCIRHLVTHCPAAHFATVSTRARDCSWYASCDFGQLRDAGLGHRSLAIDDRLLRAMGLGRRARRLLSKRHFAVNS